MWLYLLSIAALSLPVGLARYWALSRRRRHIDLLRQHDPEAASELEQAAYGASPATLPMRDRSFEKPRHPNHF